ncbi:argininosuccinate synthase [Vulgatibacter sp.]|uniref:argininosuccinate synthase n=1 Tax=Vulgatibacter sp. TaxID=1971226 RepID=UPI0035665BDF
MAGRDSVRKIVLAYSGGLDTSIILTWLKETYGAEVIAFCADLGQGEELSPLEEKAKRTGASAYVQRDLREEFVRDFVFPALRANAVYQGTYLMGTSLARPIIAKHQMEVAREFGADAVSHGATGKGNDQVRFELTYYHYDPAIKIIAPWREWNLGSRTEMLDYADKHGIPVTATRAKPYSMDRNLFHISYEGGVLEDPWNEPDASMFLLTRDPTEAPEKPQYVEISFDKGNPVAVDGERMSPATLLAKLNEIAGLHGIGRVDMVEDRFVGMKSRGVYETPGGTVLHAAHRALESITLDREVVNLRDSLIPRYAQLVYNGFWYAPERELLQSMIDESQADVSGVVRMKLYRGGMQVAGRKSENTLYAPEFSTFEKDEVYRQADAAGFINLNALRLRIRALRRSKR